MRKRISLIFGCLLFVVFTNVCFADTLTLEQAIQIALENNPTLQAKKGTLHAARGEKIIGGAILPSNPEVEGDYAFDNAFNNEGEKSFSLGLSQELEIAGQGFLRHRVATLDYQKAKAEYQNFELMTITEVETAYYTLLYKQKKKRLLDKLAVQQKELIRGAKGAVASGIIPQFDYDLLEAEHSSLLALSIAATSEWNEAALRFKESLGMPSDREVATVDYPPPIQSVDSKEVLLEYALKNQPVLRAAILNAEARKKEARLKALQFIPNPKAFVRFSQEDTRLGGLSDRDKLITIGASIPLPLTGQSRGAYVKAKGEKIAAQGDLKATELAIQKFLGDAYERYKNLKETVSQYAPVIKSADRNIDLLHSAYLKGRIPIDSFLTKRDRFINAGTNYYEAVIELAKTKRDLEIAVGSRLSDLEKEGK